MQAHPRPQAYEGHIDNGRFYPKDIPINLTGRFRAILTVLDVPTHTQLDTSADWVDELERMVKADTSPPLRIEDFPRMDFGREPIIFSDEV